jgi:hypothetical protein
VWSLRSVEAKVGLGYMGVGHRPDTGQGQAPASVLWTPVFLPCPSTFNPGLPLLH